MTLNLEKKGNKNLSYDTELIFEENASRIFQIGQLVFF